MEEKMNTTIYREQSDHQFALILRAKLVRGYAQDSRFAKLVYRLTDDEIIDDYEQHKAEARNRRLQQRTQILPKIEQPSLNEEQALVSACLSAVRKVTQVS
jgi:hypothetical protein